VTERTDLPVSDIHLVGGEMLLWSDLAPTAGKGAVVGRVSWPLMRALARRANTALVLGPHDPGLVGVLLDEGSSVSILVRSSGDAQDIARRYSEARGLDVYCGAFEQFQPAQQFDLVVALGGFDRLSSVDTGETAWAEIFERVAALLAPGGRLVLGVENQLGVHRIVDTHTPLSDWGDDAWSPRDLAEETHPPGLDELRRRFTSGGLVEVGLYGAYPEAQRPTLAVAAPVFDDDKLRNTLAALIKAAFSQGFAGRQVLSDPGTLSRLALQSGLGLHLAPLWIAVVTRPGDQADGGALALEPQMIIGEDASAEYWSVAYEAEPRGESGWLRRTYGTGANAPLRALGRVQRDVGLLNGSTAYGDLLEELLMAMTVRQDLREVRRLVRGYVEWLGTHVVPGPDGRPTLSGQHVFATPDNVVKHEGKFDLHDPSWSFNGVVPFNVMLTRSFQRFATRLLHGGYRHPWPTTLNADQLTRTMLAMADQGVTQDDFFTAARLDAEIAAAINDLSPAEEAARVTMLLADPTAGSGAVEDEVHGYRESLALVSRLREELRTARGQVEWLDSRLIHRERQLVRLRRTEEQLRSSVSYRLGRALTAPLRVPMSRLAHVLRSSAKNSKNSKNSEDTSKS
jgi:hypothetical protein